MKIYRISGLALAVLCCMTLVITAAGAAMVPVQGQDQAQSHGNSPGHEPGNKPDFANVTEQGQRPVQGNLTSLQPGHARGSAPGNMTELNDTITHPYPWNGQGPVPGNLTELQGNLTSPPPMPENRTGTWTGPGNTTKLHQGNLTVPNPGPDHGNWSGNISDQERAMNQAAEYGQQQNNKDSIIEAFLTWLKSYVKS